MAVRFLLPPFVLPFVFVYELFCLFFFLLVWDKMWVAQTWSCGDAAGPPIAVGAYYRECCADTWFTA